MVSRTIRTRAQRFAVLACVITVHAVLLLLFVLAKFTSNVKPPEPAKSLSIVSLKAEAEAPAPPPRPPKLPSKVVDTPRPISDAPPAPEIDSKSSLAASGGCKTLETITTGLLADPVVVAAIRASPPETRSIADAIVLWSARWSLAAPPQDGPLSTVRNSVEASLRATEPACLEEELVGPRLIPIPNGELTTFLVIGSGTWTWNQLLQDDPPPNEDTTPPSPVTNRQGA